MKSLFKEIMNRLDRIDSNVDKVHERLELLEAEYDYVNRNLLSDTEKEQIGNHFNV